MYMKLEMCKPQGDEPKKAAKSLAMSPKQRKLHCFTDVRNITLRMQFQKQLHSLESFEKKQKGFALCCKAACEIIRNACGFKMVTFESLLQKLKSWRH